MSKFTLQSDADYFGRKIEGALGVTMFTPLYRRTKAYLEEKGLEPLVTGGLIVQAPSVSRTKGGDHRDLDIFIYNVTTKFFLRVLYPELERMAAEEVDETWMHHRFIDYGHKTIEDGPFFQVSIRYV